MILVILDGKLRRAMVVAAAASMLALILPGCGTRSLEEERCIALTAIASDTEKMRYAKEWIASHLSDKRFQESLRTRSELGSNDPRMLDFDVKYLGIPRELVTLQFNMDVSDSGGRDIKQIDSASIRLGRTYIIIRLSAANDFGLLWPPEMLAEIKAVGDGVFVYCDRGGAYPD